MNNLLLHAATERRLENFLNHPSHAITLVAPTGSGKHSLALLLASRLLAIEPEALEHQAYLKIIMAVDGKAIGIEAIRELEHFLSLKVPSRQAIHRVVIIEDAHLLTTEAQNAFLKTLEEPPAGTVFILTSAQEQALLPTIRSRSPRLLITKPDYAALQAYFAKKYTGDHNVRQALLVSGGLPGLTDALLSQSSEHPLLPATELARQLLAQSTYERLAKVDELARDRTLCLNTLYILQQMAHLSLLSAKAAAAKRWLNILEASYQAQSSLLDNVQPKLVLTHLMLHL